MRLTIAITLTPSTGSGRGPEPGSVRGDADPGARDPAASGRDCAAAPPCVCDMSVPLEFIGPSPSFEGSGTSMRLDDGTAIFPRPIRGPARRAERPPPLGGITT
ncbi:hypothetical protein GCM10009793_33740 [Brachybacterium phenoliresistens]